MTLGRHIPPRRLVLAAFLLLGLGLRLWGLDWECPVLGGSAPEQWGWRVIDELSWSSPVYPGLITQAFFSLAALLQGAVSLIADGLALVTGQVRFVGEWSLDPRLAGRLCAALLGAGQIPLAYLLGRRCFDSVAAGLLAAAVVAVSPLLVAQSHYLSLETPLGFLGLLAALLAWRAMDDPGKTIMAALGLVLGLAAATSALGLLLWPLGAAACWAAGPEIKRPASRRRGLWLLCLAGGLLLGLALGAPALWWPQENDAPWGMSALGVLWPAWGDWGALIRERLLGQSRVLLGWEGLGVAVLWLAAVLVLVKKRQVRRLVVALSPVVPCLLAMSWPGTTGQGWLALWLPLALVTAVWPLVLLCRRLPAFAWQATAVGVLLTAIALGGAWRSAGVGYMFWQEGTVAAARFWMENNLPPGAAVLVGPGAPLDIFPGARLWRPGQDTDGAYLVLEAKQAADDQDEDRLAEYLATRQPLQRFDLRGAWSRGLWGLGPVSLEMLNPTLAVYAPVSRAQVREPLALDRPPVGAGRPYGLIYQTGTPYSRDDAVMLTPPDGKVVRVLRPQGGPPPVALRLRNLGGELLKAHLTQGPWHHRHLTLYPGQQTDMALEVRGWPPMVTGLYPVKLTLGNQGVLWARLLADPLLLGKLDMEAGRWGQAQKWLELAAQKQEGFEALSMLAGALARQNKLKEASAALYQLGFMSPGRYLSLAKEAKGHDWREGLARLTGYDLDLLERATSLNYEILGVLYLGDERPVSLQGKGFTGSLRRASSGDGLVLNLWLKTPWPQGQWKAVVKLRGEEQDDLERVLGRAELRSVGPLGSRLVARQEITGQSLEDGGLEMPFRLGRDGNRLELRLHLAEDAGLSLQGLRVGADIQGHMRRILLWYYDARGLVALGGGQHQEAVQAFQTLLELFPSYRAAYLPLARSLLEIGQLDQAAQVTSLAEEAYQAFPDHLARVAALYKDLRQKGALERVEKSMAHLRPSLKRVSRFEDGMSLLGYDLPKNKVQPGGKLEVNLYWRAWQAVPVDYTIFVHLEGPGGVLNFDHRLERGNRAMTSLRVGQVVREDLSLNIPPGAKPGTYTLTVGLWDPAVASEALRVIEGEDLGRRHLEVTKIEVAAPEASPKQ